MLNWTTGQQGGLFKTSCPHLWRGCLSPKHTRAHMWRTHALSVWVTQGRANARGPGVLGAGVGGARSPAGTNRTLPLEAAPRAASRGDSTDCARCTAARASGPPGPFFPPPRPHRFTGRALLNVHKREPVSAGRCSRALVLGPNPWGISGAPEPRGTGGRALP